MVIKVENIMDETIKELTLLLIYLTSWQEDVGLTKVQRSWKGYPFEVLDELNKEGYIDGSKRAKSVYLTEEGLSKAKELMKKYIGKEE
jgi:Mn-dependent DtxR family transcriptional regulator